MPKPLPPLRQFTALVAVVRCGSVQAAAADLNVTQPAVSQAIRQLEAHVGRPLLERGSRPARPTEAGATLAQAVSEGFGRIEAALDAIRQDEDERAVTIACSVGVATYWLMPLLSGFYREHPDLLVNVTASQTGVPALSDGVDLAIRFGHGRWRDGEVHRLFSEVVEPVCAPAMRARFDGPVPPDAVSLLHVRSDEASWTTWSAYLRAVGLPPVRGGGQSFSNYVQTTQAALDGLGMMLGWRSITGELVARGALVPAGLPPFHPRDAFFLVARHKRSGRAADTFARWLVANTGPGHAPPVGRA